ncbi:unnamed protein product [Effrenium voratum]|uniref:Methyltransferase FkbM domain-containing protein n=1 Tax=Effrenium voratum TaxID=2562239 RepID=A0AA36JAU1_9DINO|nr:unnamed protein product [Effrenium voratum]CAJ1423147.1 unnamed protein product [Effrenium voratum]
MGSADRAIRWIWYFALSFTAASPCAEEVPEFGSFALCCQGRRPAAELKEVCGHKRWRCRELLACQREKVAKAPEIASEVVPGVMEMRGYFEHLMGWYLTGEIPDPVFLDIEHILPPIFLAMATDISRHGRDHELRVLDVGAFAGAVSCACLAFWDAMKSTISQWTGEASHPLPELRVTALEPSRDRCAALNGEASPMPDLCRHQNRSRGRLSAVCVAASSQNSEAVMQCPNGMSYLADSPTSQASQSDCGEPFTVRTVTLDALTKDLEIEVDLLKIDAEGHDFEVLLGASALLSAKRLRFVIFEACGADCPVDGESQTLATINFLSDRGYVCYMIAPEMLVPVTGVWLSNLYQLTRHAFNVLCAQRQEPLLPDIIELYSRVPRAAQFALASLGAESTRAAMALSDAELRRRAIRAEEFFEGLYQRVLESWTLPHVRFVRARQLQAAGQVELALPLYEGLERQCCREPATFQAQREFYRLREDHLGIFLTDAEALRRSNGTGFVVPGVRASGALHEIVWYHRRPGSGVPFDQEHFCKAQQWLLPLANAGDALAALDVGYISHFGLCTGRMTRQSWAEGSSWYRRAAALDRPRKGVMGAWGIQAMELLTNTQLGLNSHRLS